MALSKIHTTKEYLDVVAAFSAAARQAVIAVERATHADQAPAVKFVLQRLGEIFREDLKPSLSGIDAQFRQEVRQIYGAMVAHLEGTYTMFYSINRTWSSSRGPCRFNDHVDPKCSRYADCERRARLCGKQYVERIVKATLSALNRAEAAADRAA